MWRIFRNILFVLNLTQLTRRRFAYQYKDFINKVTRIIRKKLLRYFFKNRSRKNRTGNKIINFRKTRGRTHKNINAGCENRIATWRKRNESRIKN